MDGSVPSAFGAFVVLLVLAFSVGLPVFLATRSRLLATVAIALIVGPLGASVQAHLYAELSGDR